MDYYTRYGLKFNPFLKNTKELLVKTHEYNEAMFRLDYLSKTKGFASLPVIRAGGKQRRYVPGLPA